MYSPISALLTSITAASLLLAQGCAVDDTLVEDELAATSTSGRSLTLEADHFEAGEDVLLRLHWRAPADHSPFELLRMYRAGSNDNAFIAQTYVTGMNQSSGVAAWPIPENWALDPTPLEFRWFDREGNKLATSDHVTLGFNYGVSISFDNPERRGREVTVGWRAPLLHYTGDRIRMYKVGARNEDWLDVRALNGMRQREGSVTFTLPPASQDPGPYEFRIFYQGSYHVMAVSTPVVSPE